MKTTFRGIVIMGIFSTILTLVACDRVATGELQAGRSTVADLKLKMGEPASVNREGDKEIWE